MGRGGGGEVGISTVSTNHNDRLNSEQPYLNEISVASKKPI